MKTTKREIQKIIKEEFERYLEEQASGRVYVLWEVSKFGGSVSDRRMIGIFDNREDADAVIDLVSRHPKISREHGFHIQEVEMNKPNYKALRNTGTVHRSTIRRRQKRMGT